MATLVEEACRLQVGTGRSGSEIRWALIDPEDRDELDQHRWSWNRYVYRLVPKAGGCGLRPLLLHRFLMGLDFGDPRQVDHINRDRLDYRRSNLRIVTAAQNWQNVPSKGLTSSYRGVSWSKKGGWLAQATVRGKNHNLGTYADEQEAAAVARAFRLHNMPFAVD